MLLEVWEENVENEMSENGDEVETDCSKGEELNDERNVSEMEVQSDQSEDEVMVSKESQGGEPEMNGTDQEDTDAPEEEEVPPESPLESGSVENMSDASLSSDNSSDSPPPQ